MASITTWVRLEPRPRDGALDESLQAQVRDPLWLLARQWQFGEFQGENTGSLVGADLVVEAGPGDGLRDRPFDEPQVVGAGDVVADRHVEPDDMSRRDLPRGDIGLGDGLRGGAGRVDHDEHLVGTLGSRRARRQQQAGTGDRREDAHDRDYRRFMRCRTAPPSA